MNRFSSTLGHLLPQRHLSRIIFNSLWVVILIAALLLTWQKFFPYLPNASEPRRSHGPTEISSLKMALETFALDNGRYPTTAEGLDALVHAPPDLTTWRKLLDEVPVDTWGSPFSYAFPSASDPDAFDLHSLGPDKIDDTDDDVNLQ